MFLKSQDGDCPIVVRYLNEEEIETKQLKLSNCIRYSTGSSRTTGSNCVSMIEMMNMLVLNNRSLEKEGIMMFVSKCDCCRVIVVGRSKWGSILANS
jgi:hypothetical protein